jgi:hypothetical protein
MVLLPIYLEQGIVADRARRCGFGISLPREKIDGIPSAINYILKHDSYRENCCRFKRRYAAHCPERQLERVVDYFESLVKSQDVPYLHYDFDQDSPRLIFVIGAGRFGTDPMSDLLRKQPSTVVTNEACPPPHDSLDALTQRLRALSNRWPGILRFGDAGLYYLDHVPELIQRFPNAKIICVRRCEEETIETFLDWLRPAQHPSISPRQSNWRIEQTGLDPLPLPHYPALIEQRITQFWTTYQESTERLATQFPNNVRLIDALSSANIPLSILQLFAWLRISEKDILSTK